MDAYYTVKEAQSLLRNLLDSPSDHRRFESWIAQGVQRRERYLPPTSSRADIRQELFVAICGGHRRLPRNIPLSAAIIELSAGLAGSAIARKLARNALEKRREPE